MIYITGDTHGDQVMWYNNIDSFLKPGDTIIVAGDFGKGFYDGPFWSEELFYDHLEEQGYTVLFCDGNHDDIDSLNRIEEAKWNGGRVHFIRDNVIHLMRGEIYTIDGAKVFVMGGGYSLDKERRIPGESWWPGEMPREAEYQNARYNLERSNFKVDYILTHTAPTEAIDQMVDLDLPMMRAATEELPLNKCLQSIAKATSYRKWYFGHFHIDAELENNQIALKNAIRKLHTGEIVKMRV